MKFFTKETKSAVQAKEAAQWIAFGPMLFQAARVLRNTGILEVVDKSLDDGLTEEEVVEKVK